MDFIIDGNAFLHVSIGVAQSMVFKDKSLGNKYYVEDLLNEGEYILKDPVRIQFRNFCLNYLNSLTYPTKSRIDKVHMVFDNKSWRKEFVNEFFDDRPFTSEFKTEDYIYKGNREKNPTIHLFFDYFHNEILPALVKRAGINDYNIPGTEGDDMIAFLTETLDCDCLVFTVDGDIRQLLLSETNNRLIMYPKQRTPSKRVYRTETFLDNKDPQDDLDDFFSMDDSNIVGDELESVLESLNSKDYKTVTVDPTRELLTKIFRGDAKDNISKMTKMTPKKTEKLLDLIIDKYGDQSIDLIADWDSDFVKFVVDNMMILHKLKEDNTEAREDIEKHMKFNTKIIVLKTKLFPKEVVKVIERDFVSRDLTNFHYKNLYTLKNNPHVI